MKKADKQILSILQAFNKVAVLKAFELYKKGVGSNFEEVKDDLLHEGWKPYDEPIEGREFYDFMGKYWVQTDNARMQDIKKPQNAAKPIPKNKRYTGQKMELKYTDISCPRCKAAMYKQGVCTGCTEGKKGFKIRLICEENPDHEILL